jgi:hypothetical protein
MPFSNTQFGHRLLRSAYGSAAAVLCLLGTSSCGTVTGTSTSIGQLRIIQSSPDSGGLDIYASTGAIAYNLGYGTVTSYVPVTPSTYTITADTAGSKTVLSTVKATLAASKQYTLLISNSAASLQTQVLTDQAQPAPSGAVSLRFLDEAQSVGTIDLYLVPTGSTLLQVNPLPGGQALVFGANTGYLNVATGTYTLYVVADGTVISSTTVPLYTGASTTYPAGSARTVLILDNRLVTTPPITVTTINDYDSATATQ